MSEQLASQLRRHGEAASLSESGNGFADDVDERMREEHLAQAKQEQEELALSRKMVFWGGVGTMLGFAIGSALFGGMGGALIGSTLMTVVGIGVGAVTA